MARPDRHTGVIEEIFSSVNHWQGVIFMENLFTFFCRRRFCRPDYLWHVRQDGIDGKLVVRLVLLPWPSHWYLCWPGKQHTVVDVCYCCWDVPLHRTG